FACYGRLFFAYLFYLFFRQTTFANALPLFLVGCTASSAGAFFLFSFRQLYFPQYFRPFQLFVPRLQKLFLRFLFSRRRRLRNYNFWWLRRFFWWLRFLNFFWSCCCFSRFFFRFAFKVQ